MSESTPNRPESQVGTKAPSQMETTQPKPNALITTSLDEGPTAKAAPKSNGALPGANISDELLMQENARRLGVDSSSPPATDSLVPPAPPIPSRAETEHLKEVVAQGSDRTPSSRQVENTKVLSEEALRFRTYSDEVCSFQRKLVYAEAEGQDKSTLERRLRELDAKYADLLTSSPALQIVLSEHVTAARLKAEAEVAQVGDFLSAIRKADSDVTAKRLAIQGGGDPEDRKPADYQEMYRIDTATILSFASTASADARVLASKLYQIGGDALPDWVTQHTKGMYLISNPELARLAELMAVPKANVPESAAASDSRAWQILSSATDVLLSGLTLSKSADAGANASVLQGALSSGSAAYLSKVLGSAQDLSTAQWLAALQTLESRGVKDPLLALGRACQGNIDNLCDNLAKAEALRKPDPKLVAERAAALEAFMQVLNPLREKNSIEIENLVSYKDSCLAQRRQERTKEELASLISEQAFAEISAPTVGAPKLDLVSRIKHFVMGENKLLLAIEVIRPEIGVSRFYQKDWVEKNNSKTESDGGAAKFEVTITKQRKAEYLAAHAGSLHGVDIDNFERSVRNSGPFDQLKLLAKMVDEITTSSRSGSSTSPEKVSQALQHQLVNVEQRKQSIQKEAEYKVEKLKKEGSWSAPAEHSMLAQARAAKDSLTKLYQKAVSLSSLKFKADNLPTVEESTAKLDGHEQEKMEKLKQGDLFSALAISLAKDLEKKGIISKSEDLTSAIDTLKVIGNITGGLANIEASFNHYAQMIGLPPFGKALSEYAAGDKEKLQYLKGIAAKAAGQADGETICDAANLLMLINDKKYGVVPQSNAPDTADLIKDLALRYSTEDFDRVLELASREKGKPIVSLMLNSRYSAKDELPLIKAALAFRGQSDTVDELGNCTPEELAFSAAKFQYGISRADKAAISAGLGVDKFCTESGLALRDALLKTGADTNPETVALQALYRQYRDQVLHQVGLSLTQAEAQIKHSFASVWTGAERDALNSTDVVGLLRDGRSSVAAEFYGATLGRYGTDEKRVHDLVEIYGSLNDKECKAVRHEFNDIASHLTLPERRIFNGGWIGGHSLAHELSKGDKGDCLFAALTLELQGHDRFDAVWKYTHPKPPTSTKPEDARENFIAQSEHQVAYLNARFKHESSGAVAPMLHYGTELTYLASDKLVGSHYAERNTIVDIALNQVDELNAMNKRLRSGTMLSPAEMAKLESLVRTVGMEMDTFRAAKDQLADTTADVATFTAIAVGGALTGGTGWTAFAATGAGALAARAGSKIILKGPEGYGGVEEFSADVLSAYAQSAVLVGGAYAGKAVHSMATRAVGSASARAADGAEKTIALAMGKQALHANPLRQTATDTLGEAVLDLGNQQVLAAGTQAALEQSMRKLAAQRLAAQTLAKMKDPVAENYLKNLGAERLGAAATNMSEEALLQAGRKELEQRMLISIAKNEISDATIQNNAFQQIGYRILQSSPRLRFLINSASGGAGGAVMAAGSPLYGGALDENLWANYDPLEASIMLAHQGFDRAAYGAVTGLALGGLFSLRQLFKRPEVLNEAKFQLASRYERMEQLRADYRKAEFSELEARLNLVDDAPQPGISVSQLRVQGATPKLPPSRNGPITPPTPRFNPQTRPVGIRVDTPAPRFLTRQQSQSALAEPANPSTELARFRLGGSQEIWAELRLLEVESRALESVISANEAAGASNLANNLPILMKIKESELNYCYRILERNRLPWRLSPMSEEARTALASRIHKLEGDLHEYLTPIWEERLNNAIARRATTPNAAAQAEVKEARKGLNGWRAISAEHGAEAERQAALRQFSEEHTLSQAPGQIARMKPTSARVEQTKAKQRDEAVAEARADGRGTPTVDEVEAAHDSSPRPTTIVGQALSALRRHAAATQASAALLGGVKATIPAATGAIESEAQAIVQRAPATSSFNGYVHKGPLPSPSAEFTTPASRSAPAVKAPQTAPARTTVKVASTPSEAQAIGQRAPATGSVNGYVHKGQLPSPSAEVPTTATRSAPAVKAPQTAPARATVNVAATPVENSAPNAATKQAPSSEQPGSSLNDLRSQGLKDMYQVSHNHLLRAEQQQQQARQEQASAALQPAEQARTPIPMRHRPHDRYPGSLEEEKDRPDGRHHNLAVDLRAFENPQRIAIQAPSRSYFKRRSHELVMDANGVWKEVVTNYGRIEEVA